VTLFLVLIGWVLFRSASIEYAWGFTAAMFDPFHLDVARQMLDVLTNEKLVVFAIAFVTLLLPRHFVTGRYLTEATGPRPVLLRAALLLVAVPWAIMRAAHGSFSPFLYFQF
jgi:alginate O-acetyltransferase complex protein AlgI